MNYDEKQLSGVGGDLSFSFYLYRFRKYVSYGFPIKNFVMSEYNMKRPVCMYVCIYVCMYVCMYICMYVCIYVCMHVCTCVRA